MKYKMIILLICINISLVLAGCTVNKYQKEHQSCEKSILY